MSAEVWAAFSAVGVSAATAVGGVYTARAGRRTRGQERRDDFAAVTERLEKHLERLEHRIDEQEQETAELRDRASGAESTARYLAGWLRSLVGYIRASGLEPPPAPQPIPDEVRPYVQDIV